MPDGPPVRSSLVNPLPFVNDVDTTRTDDERFTQCDGSRWVSATRSRGTGAGTLIQFVPTFAAREHAVSNDPISFTPWDPVYEQMWSDLNSCARPNAALTQTQHHSLYIQMACHAKLGYVNSHYVGGNTWDLEAWRKDQSWAAGLNPAGLCGRRYGILEHAADFLIGHLVNARAFAKPAPDEEHKAWLIYPRGTSEKLERRHVKTLGAYNCLRQGGKGPAEWFPQDFLATYTDIGSTELVETDVCPSTPSSTPLPRPGPGPIPPSQPRSYVEQQGSLGANTFINPYNASGMGPKIPPYGYVEVTCKVYAPQIVSANPDGYWYRIRSSPWNDAYYAVANTFWNGDVPGQKPYVHNTDFNVRDC
jgi:hypothetical protein